MTFSQSFRMAIKSILSSKARSLLTMLGIIIGVAAVMVIVGLGNGMETYMVDTIESNSRGLAVSKPLPLGRYIIKEVSSPQFYSINSEEVTVYLEHEGQIVQMEWLNESVYTNVSIDKSGYTQVVPGQEIRYTFQDIGNNSTVH